jgi:hypothetical protein
MTNIHDVESESIDTDTTPFIPTTSTNPTTLAHFTFHISLFTFHISHFTFHISDFTFHLSHLHISLFTFYNSLFTFHISPLNTSTTPNTSTTMHYATVHFTFLISFYISLHFKYHISNFNFTIQISHFHILKFQKIIICYYRYLGNAHIYRFEKRTSHDYFS